MTFHGLALALAAMSLTLCIFCAFSAHLTFEEAKRINAFDRIRFPLQMPSSLESSQGYIVILKAFDPFYHSFL